MSWMKRKITNLERELKDVRAELDAERARPAPSSEREDYLIGQLDLINQQLECEDIRQNLRLLVAAALTAANFACLRCAGVNLDKKS